MDKLPDYSAKKFLLVDDDRFMLGLVDRMLKECKASVIVKASDGATALRTIKDNFTQVDCIITDYNMKPINGLQLLQGIRLGINPNIPREQAVVMLTGHGETDVVKTAIALDVNGYVVKPVALEKLVQAIDRALQKSIDVKSTEYYRGIKIPKVENAMEESPAVKAKAWTVLANGPFRRESSLEKKVQELKKIHATRDGIEEIKLKNERSCAVNELLEGQVLAQHIEAEEGVILLRRGTYLTNDMIARLRELAAETQPDQTIWVGEAIPAH